jgi:hypothetical protein
VDSTSAASAIAFAIPRQTDKQTKKHEEEEEARTKRKITTRYFALGGLKKRSDPWSPYSMFEHVSLIDRFLL